MLTIYELNSFNCMYLCMYMNLIHSIACTLPVLQWWLEVQYMQPVVSICIIIGTQPDIALMTQVRANLLTASKHRLCSIRHGLIQHSSQLSVTDSCAHTRSYLVNTWGKCPAAGAVCNGARVDIGRHSVCRVASILREQAQEQRRWTFPW
jgi:hypothetical protein